MAIKWANLVTSEGDYILTSDDDYIMVFIGPGDWAVLWMTINEEEEEL